MSDWFSGRSGGGAGDAPKRGIGWCRAFTIEYLQDIVESCERIFDTVEGKSGDDFVDAGNGECKDARNIVSLHFLYIEKYAAKIIRKDGGFCALHPEMALDGVTSLKSLVFSEYGDRADWRRVWELATVGLPKLVEAIGPIAASYSNRGEGSLSPKAGKGMP